MLRFGMHEALHFPSKCCQCNTVHFHTVRVCNISMLDGENWCRSFQSLLCVCILYSSCSCFCFCCCFIYTHTIFSLSLSFSCACSVVRWFVPFFVRFLFSVSTLSRYTKLHRLFSAYDGSAAGQTNIIEYHHAKRTFYLLTTDISV